MPKNQMDSREIEERYERQVSLFGDEGQRRIRQVTIGVVGLGGLGSHICQQFAYLGINKWVIVDDDNVDVSNLNRLIGAIEKDIGSSKTSIMKRMIESIQPDSVVKLINQKLPNEEINTGIAEVDLIIGCVDNDYPRSNLLKIAADAKVPYIDCASDVNFANGLTYGGRVLCMGTTRGCLYCLGHLDQDMIRRAQMSDDELEIEAKIYGIPVHTLKSSGPSVVNLNGVVASLAAVESMAFLTGMREPKKFLNYRADLGTVNSRQDVALSECYYCAAWGF